MNRFVSKTKPKRQPIDNFFRATPEVINLLFSVYYCEMRVANEAGRGQASPNAVSRPDADDGPQAEPRRVAPGPQGCGDGVRARRRAGQRVDHQTLEDDRAEARAARRGRSA